MVHEVVQLATETMVLNSLVIYTQNEEQNIDRLKFRIDLVEGLLVKYSVLHGVSAHDSGNNNKRPLSKKNTSHRKETYMKKTVGFLQQTQRGGLHTNVKAVTLLCASIGVARSTIQGKITDVM